MSKFKVGDYVKFIADSVDSKSTVRQIKKIEDNTIYYTFCILDEKPHEGKLPISRAEEIWCLITPLEKAML